MSKAGKPELFLAAPQKKEQVTNCGKKRQWVPLFENRCTSFCPRGFLQEWHTLCPCFSQSCYCIQAAQSCELSLFSCAAAEIPAHSFWFCLCWSCWSHCRGGQQLMWAVPNLAQCPWPVQSAFGNLASFQCGGLGIVLSFGEVVLYTEEGETIPILCCSPNPHLFIPTGLPGAPSYSLGPQTLTASNVP